MADGVVLGLLRQYSELVGNFVNLSTAGRFLEDGLEIKDPIYLDSLRAVGINRNGNDRISAIDGLDENRRFNLASFEMLSKIKLLRGFLVSCGEDMSGYEGNAFVDSSGIDGLYSQVREELLKSPLRRTPTDYQKFFLSAFGDPGRKK